LTGDLLRDLRYTARTARQNPWSTLAAVAILTIGIGAVTAVFSVINGLLLRPLPVYDADRLVRLFESDAATPRDNVSMQDYLDWERHLTSFQNLALYGVREANLTGAGDPKHVLVYRCEATLLPVLGLPPALGRNFRSEEDQVGRDQVAILSWALWKTRFAGANVLGQKILLENRPYTVVGVLPRDLYVLGVEPADVWIPLTFDLTEVINTRGYRWYTGIGRLKPGVSAARANSELRTIAAALASEYPKQNAGVNAVAVPLRTWLTRNTRPAVMMLFAAVVCVLLIAMGNVANLLLVRASARQHEMSVRIAIGATHSSIIRQLLTESILLSLTGALAGVGMASVAIRLIKVTGLRQIRDPQAIIIDWHVLMFAAAIGLLTGTVFGLAPLTRTWSTRLNETLKESNGRATETRAQQRLRQAFVFLQTAMATLLLIGAALLIQSFAKAAGIDPGFDPNHLLTLRVSLPESRYAAPDAIARFSTAVVDRARSVPGVESVALTSSLPLIGETGGSGPVWIEGRPRPAHMSNTPDVHFSRITPAYFDTMKIPLLRGRAFTERDARTAPQVAIVNEELARQFFGGENPVGKRIAHLADHPQWKEIVGVVRNARQQSVETRISPELFIPLAQEEDGRLAAVARVAGDPIDWAEPLETQMHAVDPQLPVYAIKPMRQIVADELGWRAFHTSVLTAFAAIAMLLAAVGIYAVIAYSTAQRISEIGVRIALGAGKQDIVRMIVRQGVTPAFLGSIAGVALSFAATGLLSTLLFGVRPTDWRTYVSALLLLTVVAAAGSYLPARRAAATDAWRALRYE